MRTVACALILLAHAAVPATAQTRLPSDGGTTASLGQPERWKWTAAGAAAWQAGEHMRFAATDVALGVQRDLLNPMLGMAALHAEAYGSAGPIGGSDTASPDGTRAGGGLRLRLISPFARVGVGADYRLAGDVDVLLSAFHPIRRGGVFHDGSMVRLDYLPGRSHTLAVGVELPVLRRVPMGRTRPGSDDVRLPASAARGSAAPLPAPAAAALQEVSDAADAIRRLTLPALAAPPPADPEAQVRRYHAALESAFGAAAQEAAAGCAVAAQARALMLEHVLLPYNRLLGQAKRRDSVLGLGSTAHSALLHWLHTTSEVSPQRAEDVLRVFDAWLDIVEHNRVAALRQWRDARFVWLPLQYALLPEQHDSQAELDALIERALGERFWDGNFVSYAVNEQFQYHLSRTIRAAEEYHVLWTHDFRGIDVNGDPDEMSFRHVLRSYYAALTARVREYDSTGRMPVYMIVLDQWFYEVNRGRLWLTLLEDPVHYRIDLPPGFASWEDSIAAAQTELRAAIAASSLLQAQRRRFGDAWLRNLIKVHVNITNPSDPSFWSTGVVRAVPLPDNMMRDHRKVVFYDLTEEDPYRGEAIFTGAGIGEHYANLSWEDRSLLVRGPAVIGLKDAARAILLNHGVAAGRIPHPLQPRARAADYDARVRDAIARNPQPLRALQMHNGSGYGDKDVNVAKALLYTLMPAGSVLKIPDSLWNSDFWASALYGGALRGVRVMLIAPAAPNAPADAFGALGRSREMLHRLIAAGQLAAPQIADAGGMLRIGLFAAQHDVADIPAKVRSAQVAFARQAWLRDLFGFPQYVYDGLGMLADALEGMSMAPQPMEEFEYDVTPKLHLKANFFASREAWTLMTRREWSDASFDYAQTRIAQLQERRAAVRTLEGSPDALADVGIGVAMVHDWLRSLEPTDRERVVFYTLMGSHNQNSRSMVIDAEVGLLVSAWPGIIPYIDLITIIGQTHWLDRPEDLEGMLPLDTGWTRRLARWFRLAI